MMRPRRRRLRLPLRRSRAWRSRARGRPAHLLTALLSTLLSCPWIKVSFRSPKRMRSIFLRRSGTRLSWRWLKLRPRLRFGPWLPVRLLFGNLPRRLRRSWRLLFLRTPRQWPLCFWPLLNCRPRLLLLRQAGVFLRASRRWHVLMASELVQPRIVRVDILVDRAIVDLRTPRHRRWAIPRHIIKIHILVHAGVVVDVLHVHRAIDDRFVYCNVVYVYCVVYINVCHVNVAPLDKRPRTPLPSLVSPPARVINAVVAPIGIAIQPHANEQAPAKREPEAKAAVVVTSAIINDGWIIRRNVDIFRSRRPDLNESSGGNDLPLRRGHQVALIVCQPPQPLNGFHNVGGLIDVRLPDRCRPVQLFVHHFQYFRIMRHGTPSVTSYSRLRRVARAQTGRSARAGEQARPAGRPGPARETDETQGEPGNQRACPAIKPSILPGQAQT